MLQVLTEEEGVKIEEEMNKFLLSLDFNTKSALVNLLKPTEHYFKMLKEFSESFKHQERTKDISVGEY